MASCWCNHIGVSSLAIGTVAGAFFGPFLLNAVFAHRAGTRYRPLLDWHDEGLREWVRLSLPLIIGVSLVTADNWIIAHFASGTSGAVSLMSYAKQLFTRAHGRARPGRRRCLHALLRQPLGQKKSLSNSPTPSPTPSRASACLGLLAASAMVALGRAAHRLLLHRRTLHLSRLQPLRRLLRHLLLLHVLLVRPRPSTRAPSTPPATPSSPWPLEPSSPSSHSPFTQPSTTGTEPWAWPSHPDIGIALQTITIAVLLHKRRMVSLASLDYPELGRCLFAAIVSGAVVWIVFSWLTGIAIRHWTIPVRIADLAILILGSILWLAITDRILLRTGSALPKVARRRLHLR